MSAFFFFFSVFFTSTYQLTLCINNLTFVAAAEPKMYADSRTVFKTVILLLGTRPNEVTIHSLTKYMLNCGHMVPEREIYLQIFHSCPSQ